MINTVYEINGEQLFVYCEILEYGEQLKKWLKPYKENPLDIYENYIKIYKNKIEWKINGNKNCINGMIKHTDLYPLFYNIVANLTLDDFNILLHSVVLLYNNIGVLVVGDFDSGKTMLCLEALKNNIEVVSADQSILCYYKNKLTLILGSSYMKINQNHEMFLEKCNREVNISLILNIVGVCDNGNLSWDLVKNKDHIIKSMFKFCTWHSDIPLFTKSIMLNIDRLKIYKWLSKINVPYYMVRGDSKKIIMKLKEILK